MKKIKNKFQLNTTPDWYISFHKELQKSIAKSLIIKHNKQAKKTKKSKPRQRDKNAIETINLRR